MKSYCLKCKKVTDTNGMTMESDKRGRQMMKGKCSLCESRKIKYVNNSEGGNVDVHKVISKLPTLKSGWVLPGYRYLGPMNPLEEQLDENDKPKPGHEPKNELGDIARRYDICYRDNNNKQGKSKCDKMMLNDLRDMKPKNFREKADRAAIRAVIGTKYKLGLGVEKQKKSVKWSDELAEELHNLVKKKFKKRKVVVYGIDQTWASDLVDMQPWSKYNKGYKYLLTVIDTFSKYGWAVPLKDKNGETVASAFKEIMTRGRKPENVWVDKGNKFYNKHVRALLNINSTENEEKSSVVGRWNRTMKEKKLKYFTANSTNEYLPVLQDLVKQYNNIKHSSVKMTPAQASM